MAETVVSKSGAGRRLHATAIGGIAVLLWATLALLTTAAQPVPPFQLMALTFGIAFLLAVGKWMIARSRGGPPLFSHLRQPGRVWALGVAGLFGYHFFYFTALGIAPPADASLIAFLWPLLIVLLSALLPGERLRWWHLAGGVAGLVGAGLLVTRGGGMALRPEYIIGYLAALACAFTWSIYSVISRRFGEVPSDAVGGFCGVTAVLALISHLLFEQTQWPDASGWLAVMALGIGPVGAAFFVWDYGVKHGDIKALGALAYAAPLLSTLLLISFGRAEASWTIALACILIVGGAVLASGDMLRRR